MEGSRGILRIEPIWPGRAVLGEFCWQLTEETDDWNERRLRSTFAGGAVASFNLAASMCLICAATVISYPKPSSKAFVSLGDLRVTALRSTTGDYNKLRLYMTLYMTLYILLH